MADIRYYKLKAVTEQCQKQQITQHPIIKWLVTIIVVMFGNMSKLGLAKQWSVLALLQIGTELSIR